MTSVVTIGKKVYQVWYENRLLDDGRVVTVLVGIREKI